MKFTDSFDAAVDDDPTYGLNDSIAVRQRAVQRGITYRRTSGLWYTAPAPRPWYSQVNHSNRRGVLSFWLGTSAVRLDAPVIAGLDGLTVVRAKVDPVTGDAQSKEWASLVLTPDQSSAGYVTGKEVSLGALVRSNGEVQVFHRGKLIAESDDPAEPDDDGRYTFTVTAKPGAREVAIDVNSTAIKANLEEGFPRSNWLHMGAYLSDDTMTTTFDDLAASALQAPRSSSTLRYFGYYAARITEKGGNHLGEVRGRSNLNWINISDYSRYAPEVLDSCAPKSCVVNTGNEFFKDCDSEDSPACGLYPNYQERWKRLADTVRPHIDKVAAFYLLDEPFHRGASAKQLATSAAEIKKTFPSAKVMMVEAGPKVTSSMTIPSEVDWVGFDWYCKSVTEVEQTLRTLESRITPEQRVFLFPQATPLPACGDKVGYQTDAELSKLQWDYIDLARSHPKVLGLMSFGLWVEKTSASQVPRTIDTHERIAALIVSLH